jgi:FKBP-type peptidyl-prolyl cis-trans isomerase SlyD
MNMQVAKNMVVTLDYSVTDVDGRTGRCGSGAAGLSARRLRRHFPMIEEAMHGKRIGESVVVKMQPDDAFGEYDAALVQLEPRSQFPQELQVGMQFEGVPEGADDEDDDDGVLIYRVTEIADDKVVLDGNHPWPAWRWCLPVP